jgi:hypothetical protein
MENVDRIVAGQNLAAGLICKQKGTVNAHEKRTFQSKEDTRYGRHRDGIPHHRIQLQLMFLAVILIARAMARRLVIASERKNARIGNVAISRMIEAHASSLAAKQQDHQQDSGDNGHGFDG